MPSGVESLVKLVDDELVGSKRCRAIGRHNTIFVDENLMKHVRVLTLRFDDNRHLVCALSHWRRCLENRRRKGQSRDRIQGLSLPSTLHYPFGRSTRYTYRQDRATKKAQ